MFKFTSIILLAAVTLMMSCRKGDPVNEYYFGSFSAELLALPGSGTLDVYVDDHKVDSLPAGVTIGLASKLMLSAGKPSKISFKKAGTDSLIVDTTISAGAGEMVPLKIAYSSLLGIRSFTSASDASVGADSTAFFLFNQLPVEFVEDGVQLDAYLYKSTADGSYEEAGVVWTNIERNVLHPTMATIKVTANEDGSSTQYVIKVKNVSTGQFLMDSFNRDYFAPYYQAGSREIVTLGVTQIFTWWIFQPGYAIY
jgi:hypothetical protein